MSQTPERAETFQYYKLVLALQEQLEAAHAHPRATDGERAELLDALAKVAQVVDELETNITRFNVT